MKKIKEFMSIAFILAIVMVGAYKVCYAIAFYGTKGVFKIMDYLKRYLAVLKKSSDEDDALLAEEDLECA